MHCKTCGESNCKKHSFLLGKTKFIDKIQGSSPPEIFVGRWNYPNVYAGILTPEEYGDTEPLSSPEIWHSQKFPIPTILKLRNKLIYGRTKINIKQSAMRKKFLPIIQEVAMTHKSIASEMQLKKPITKHDEQDRKVPLISNTAEMKSIRLQENAPVKKKIDYLINDSEVKSIQAIKELDKARISTSSIIKLLSAGLLGLKKNRKLVPTRWAITATDDILSKEKLSRIRHYSEISEIQVFHSEYLGNHYEFLLLPEKWSFEVIEISLKDLGVWQDYESFFPRKNYAEDVTGAYYANRLALTEYLDKIRRQCKCIVLRQISSEYYAPLGVGILRQISRDAFSRQGDRFNTIQEAYKNIQSRLKINIGKYIQKSIIMQNYGQQKRLSQFF